MALINGKKMNNLNDLILNPKEVVKLAPNGNVEIEAETEDEKNILFRFSMNVWHTTDCKNDFDASDVNYDENKGILSITKASNFKEYPSSF